MTRTKQTARKSARDVKKTRWTRRDETAQNKTVYLCFVSAWKHDYLHNQRSVVRSTAEPLLHVRHYTRTISIVGVWTV